MDGLQVSPGSTLVSRGEEARERLEEGLKALSAALEEFNILPGHPEAKFVATMAGTQRAFGGMAIAFADDLRGVIAAAQNLTEAQAQRLEAMVSAETKHLQEMLALADQTIRQTKAAGMAAEAEADKAVTTVVAHLVPEITKALREAVVVKEVTHNKRMLRREYLKTAAVVAAIFLSGYAVHGWQSWDVTSAVARCRANMLVDPAGRGYCAADRMFADPAPVAQPRR